jgi:hypothetical protein
MDNRTELPSQQDRRATPWWRRNRWSPYAVGAGIGVLSWITFALMGKALGTSTTAVRAAAAVEGLVAKEHVEQSPYFAKYAVGTPVIEWQFALVVMLAAGAFVAAKLSRQPRLPVVPPTWRASFGPSRGVRLVAAFVGGAVLVMGARLAGGCTSGHSISGGLQLAVSSYVFTAALFATGVATALLIYRPRRVGGAAAVRIDAEEG